MPLRLAIVPGFHESPASLNAADGGLPELQYPFHDRSITVTECGRICMNEKR